MTTYLLTPLAKAIIACLILSLVIMAGIFFYKLYGKLKGEPQMKSVIEIISESYFVLTEPSIESLGSYNND